MNHDERRLVRYLSGDLGEAERIRVERHLDRCERCRMKLAVLRKVENSLDRWPDRTPPAGIRQGVLARLTAERECSVRRQGMFPYGAWVLGAGAAAAALLLMGVRALQPSTPTPAAVVGSVRAGGAQDTVAVLRGAEGRMTVVWLVQKDDRSTGPDQRSGT